MNTQIACRHCKYHSMRGNAPICILRSVRVRPDDLCDQFDFRNSSAKTLTIDELDALNNPVSADGFDAWAKRNAS
jgi:hypothetical protein